MRKLVLLLVALVCLLAAPIHVSAQQALHIAKLEIDLWPEYDQPSVLVIYRVSLAQDTTLPASVSLRIPAGAQVNALAVKDTDGQLLNLTHESQTVNGMQVLQFQVTLPDFQLEYYDPSLKKDATQRTFLYQWPGDYVVDQVDVMVQQPFDANQTSIIPGPVTSRANSDGMTYFSKPVGSLSAGQSFKLEIAYQKPTDRLSAEFMQVQASAPLPSQSTTSTDLFQQAWPWALGGLGIVMIAGGGFWYWRSSRQTSPKGRKRGRASSAARREQETRVIDEDISGDAVYCHQCGRRAASADKFCRVCGTRLRSGS